VTIADPAQVVLESEPHRLGQVVKLTVIHDGFDPASTVLEMISGGWPRLL
jgi:hypothetical protein